MAKVFLAIPQYKKLHPSEVERLKTELDMDGWEPTLPLGFHPMFDVSVARLFERHRIRYCVISGDGNLPRARSYHLGKWRMEYDNPDLRCDYFMIVDDDLSFPAEAIDILIADDKPIVGGIYTFKTSNPDLIGTGCSRIFDEGQILRDDLPFEIRWLNGGFIMVKAETLLKMIDAYPELLYDVPEETKLGATRTWALWCPFVYQDIKRRFFLSEDWAFCQRARQIGFPIYADLRFKLWHWNGENGYSIGL